MASEKIVTIGTDLAIVTNQSVTSENPPVTL